MIRFFIVAFVFILISGCESKKSIGVQPLGDFERELADSVASALASVYDEKVYVLSRLPVPPTSFTNLKGPRCRADSIIKILRREKPDSLLTILALTTKDISISKFDSLQKVKEPKSKYEDWGVFGYGYINGSSSVVSIFRFRNPDKELLLARLKKIAIHEVGHNLGLQHCKSTACVMQDAAETIRTVDRVIPRLCENCLHKVKKSL